MADGAMHSAALKGSHREPGGLCEVPSGKAARELGTYGYLASVTDHVSPWEKGLEIYIQNDIYQTLVLKGVRIADNFS